MRYSIHTGNFDWNLIPRQSFLFFFTHRVVFMLAVTNSSRELSSCLRLVIKKKSGKKRITPFERRVISLSIRFESRTNVVCKIK